MSQSHANEDGTYTYVITPKDIGAANWLDSSGLHRGVIFIRWQAFGQPVEDAEGNAVREIRTVKLHELDAVMKNGSGSVSAAERERQLQQRRSEYLRRCGKIQCDAGNQYGLVHW